MISKSSPCLFVNSRAHSLPMLGASFLKCRINRKKEHESLVNQGIAVIVLYFIEPV